MLLPSLADQTSLARNECTSMEQEAGLGLPEGASSTLYALDALAPVIPEAVAEEGTIHTPKLAGAVVEP